MSYRAVSSRARGFGAIPSGLVTASTASARLGVAASGDPTAQLAAGALEAALSGKAPSFRSTVDSGLQTVATVGAAAACAATGAGAALAPICGYIASSVAGSVSRLLFGPAETCGAAYRAARDGAYGAMRPLCKGDGSCDSAVFRAAERYAERTYGSCALTDNWSMKPQIQAEATKLGIALGKGENGIFGFASEDWKAHTQNRFSSEVGAAVLAAKMRRWEAQAKEAKAVADAEYDALSRSCPKPGIRIPGTTTACEKKAASTATIIASQGYLFAVTDGAQGIAAAQNTALRNQFLAEVAQDKVAATTAATAAATVDRLDQEKREKLSRQIIGAASSTRNRTLAGIALLGAATLGGVYLYQKGAFR